MAQNVKFIILLKQIFHVICLTVLTFIVLGSWAIPRAEC